MAATDATTVSVSKASATRSTVGTTTLNFPVSRGGDTSYEAYLKYHTLNGSAVAGIDYSATSGVLRIPAGSIGGAIPVTIARQTGAGGADKTFVMRLDDAAGVGPAPSFAASQDFAEGRQQTSATAADVNGDGKPDLIVTNANGQHSNAVSVLLNTTAPGAAMLGFAAPRTYGTGHQPLSVVAADLNGDGKPDLVLVNATDATVGVLLNTTAPGAATPSYAVQQTFAVGNVPVSVAAADVNGDGRLDLLIANSQDNTVSVLLNTTAPGASTPSFAAQQAFATGNYPDSIAAADINGDGKPDLIAANQDSGGLSVLLNTTAPGAATPSFAAEQIFATGVKPASLKAADLNGDGKPDLIVANQGGNTVSVLINSTAPGAARPSFAAQNTFAAGDSSVMSSSVRAMDVDGDGKPDLIVGVYTIGSTSCFVSILLNITAPGAATPSFAAPRIHSTGQSPLDAAADLNNDGKPDLIMSNNNAGTVTVLLNTTPDPPTSFDANSFSAPRSFATGNTPNSVTAVDVNGDGKPDLLIANENSNTVSVLLNTTAPGAAVPAYAAQQTFATGHRPIFVTAQDINGDGRPDLLVANASDNNVSVLLNTTAPGASTAGFGAQHTFAAGSGPSFIAAADITGDGRPDLVVTDQLSGEVSVLVNVTAPGVTTPLFESPKAFTVGSRPDFAAVVDVNGDGRPDLVVANQAANSVSVLLNSSAASETALGFRAEQTFSTGSSPFSVVAADLNGDGRPDLLIANNGEGSVSVLRNTTVPGANTASFDAQQKIPVGQEPVFATATDLNGDGRPDLLAVNQLSNTISALLNTTAAGASTLSFAAQKTFAVGSRPYLAAAVDLNGDARPDLVVANFGGNTVSVLLNTQYQGVLGVTSAIGTIHPAPLPASPSALSATAGNTRGALHWTASTGATGYNNQRRRPQPFLQ